jgi:hypothetical protein
MTTASLQGLSQTKTTKKELKAILSSFKGVKDYNDFGKEEYKVFTCGYNTLAAIDLNTNQIYINLKLVEL